MHSVLTHALRLCSRLTRGSGSRHNPRSVRPEIESLEDRALMAGGITLAAGIIHIQGTRAADSAEVRLDGDQVIVRLSDGRHASQRSYGLQQVTGILFNGGDGNDRFQDFTPLPSVARGGRGNDTLIGGPEDLLLGGSGKNRMLQTPGSFFAAPPPNGNGAAAPVQANVLADVKTTSSVVVTGTKGDSKDKIKKAIQDGLKKAAEGETDPAVKAVMEAAAANDKLLDALAARACNEFAQGADAYTICVIGVSAKGTIVVVNIEILPPDCTDELRKHEDGHAFINNEIAKQLGQKLLDKNGGDPEKTRQAIADAQQEANDAYDKATDHGTKGDQKAEAQKALDDVVNKMK